MGRLIGYVANRSDRLAVALHQEREAVTPPPASSATGWGLGFYQNGEVLHKKRPQLDPQGFDWKQVAKDVHSDCVVLHLRQPTVGDFRTSNTHPFRMRRWLFAHTGTLSRFEAIQGAIRESLPDFLARNVRGSTDSELFFHVILSFLHDEGQLDLPEADPARVAQAIRSAIALLDRLGAEVRAEPSTLNSVLTNGNLLFGIRRGEPMAFVERRGMHDPPDDMPPAKPGTPNVLRYVMVVGGATGQPNYVDVPENGLVVVNRDLKVQTHEL